MNHPNRNWRARLEAEIAALGRDLVSAYITYQRGPTQAARLLSEATGRNYTANLLCRWRRGDAPTPEVAQRAMRWAIIEALDLPVALGDVMSPP